MTVPLPASPPPHEPQAGSQGRTVERQPTVAPMVPGARSVVRLTLRPVLQLWLRLHVEGAHHVPAEGPVLVASTHQSHADSVALGVAIRRPIHFLGDVRLTQWPVIGPLLPKLGMVPLRRGEADADAMHVLGDLLADGRAVAVYPEGSRSRDGRVHRLRSGLVRLAVSSGAQVVPAAVAGIYDVWPIGARPRLRGGRVTVRFGPPLAPPEPTPRARREFNDRLQVILAELGGTECADDFSPFGGGA
ncbi:lysophospholipid acyltransferase family protein [Egicoccus sp. AB-alg6-2]|uniref:lysophospholipid acyltransferase family protein n=1 Tax=Egicoccus sp. AB-alg6-2 TaxID=3242692 RepID=UPI00359DB202